MSDAFNEMSIENLQKRISRMGKTPLVDPASAVLISKTVNKLSTVIQQSSTTSSEIASKMVIWTVVISTATVVNVVVTIVSIFK